MISQKMWHHDLNNSNLKRCGIISHLWMKTMILYIDHKSISLVKTKVMSNRLELKLKNI